MGRAALAAASMLLMSCTTTPPPLPPLGIDYRPVTRSTLVTGQDLRFVQAQWQQGARWTTALARQQGGSDPRPLAQLVQVRHGDDLQVSVTVLRELGDGPAQATLEQLYAQVLRLEPLARYCVALDAQPCDPAREGVSHAQALQALARARDRLASRTEGAVPWRVVEMIGPAAPPWDPDRVGVRLMAGQQPLEGIAVHFNRAPHSLCVARTRADGTADCRLVDQHGDEHTHDHAQRVVATFPGDVRTDRVLLPTTHVLPAPRIPVIPRDLPARP